MKIERVIIIGLGLIGGSLALEFRKQYPGISIGGIDISEENVKQALALNLVDFAASFDDLEQTQMVVLSTQVDSLPALALKVLEKVSENCIVFDTGSTKAEICNALNSHPKRYQFLATHPIAGTEFSGPNAAHNGLFTGKTNIICEIEKTAFKLQEMALEFFTACKMRIRYMNPVAHDRHIAYVSHLSHISSFMLGKTVIEKEKNERDIFDLAGSGFESTVRLAKSSPDMWTPIFKQNQSNVIESLDEYINNLLHFKKLLAGGNYTEIYEEMNGTNRIREILEQNDK